MILSGNRRYYSNKDIYILKLIYNLLKTQDDIGAKRVLNKDLIDLDQKLLLDIKGKKFKEKIKIKVVKLKSILEKIKKIK